MTMSLVSSIPELSMARLRSFEAVSGGSVILFRFSPHRSSKSSNRVSTYFTTAPAAPAGFSRKARKPSRRSHQNSVCRSPPIFTAKRSTRKPTPSVQGGHAAQGRGNVPRYPHQRWPDALSRKHGGEDESRHAARQPHRRGPQRLLTLHRRCWPRRKQYPPLDHRE
ncbi:MAG: hypothetical protein RLZZ398_622 [Verrucomicrobiota bacterium]